MKTRVNDPSIRGKFLYKNAVKNFTEDFLDEDTGEVVSIERNEIVAVEVHTLTM